MATRNLMMQVEVDQFSSVMVSTVAPLEDQAFLFLDPNKKIVVREIAVQKNGGVLVSSPGALTFVDMAYARLRLVFPASERSVVFYAPSHVPSPEIEGAALAILEVSATGLSFQPPAMLSVGRIISCHAYLDEIDIP